MQRRQPAKTRTGGLVLPRVGFKLLGLGIGTVLRRGGWAGQGKYLLKLISAVRLRQVHAGLVQIVNSRYHAVVSSMVCPVIACSLPPAGVA